MLYRKEIPIRYRPDVLVVGGGPAGLCAAVAAARGGARTLLVERNGFCGGMATAALVAPFMTCYESGGHLRVIRGLFSEVVDRLVARGGAIRPEEVGAPSAFTSYITNGHIHVTPFKPEALKMVADEMLAEAGVTVLYHTAMADALCDGDLLTQVVLHEKGGLSVAEPKSIIDCTGDGDVAAAAGVPYTFGNAQRRAQPATMFFTVGHVDTARVEQEIEAHKHTFHRENGVAYRAMHWLVTRAKEKGDFSLDRASIGMYRGVEEDEWCINTSRVLDVDGTDSASLSRGEMIGRRQADEIMRFLRNYVPGFENARLIATGGTLGIRETRHIAGRRTLTVDDLLACRLPADTVAVAANAVDVHGKNGPNSTEYIPLPEGKYYGIPYGCLLPVGLRNLLVAGRSLSADSDAAGAVRVMPPCMAMGQAAGTAAALSHTLGVDVCDCPVEPLRAALRRAGVFLGE